MGNIIVITGTSGLVGSTIETMLKKQGFEIKTLQRWDINKSLTEKDLTNKKKSFWSNPEVLEGAEAVIHLAGANVGEAWTKKHKSNILYSRVNGTRALVDCIKSAQNPPKRLISASAIGYYQDPSATVLYEDAPKGSGFLSDVCAAWEEEALAVHPVCPVTIVRIGLVLSNRSKLLQASYYQFLLSGMVGSTGRSSNAWSWIHVEDLANIFIEASTNNIPSGIYNGVSPAANTQQEVGWAYEQSPLQLSQGNFVMLAMEKFGSLLNTIWQDMRWLSMGKRLKIRPIIPAFVMKLAWGERSVLALTNQRVSAQKLQSAGFVFKYPSIQQALSHLSQNPQV